MALAPKAAVALSENEVLMAHRLGMSQRIANTPRSTAAMMLKARPLCSGLVVVRAAGAAAEIPARRLSDCVAVAMSGRPLLQTLEQLPDQRDDDDEDEQQYRRRRGGAHSVVGEGGV